MGYSTLNAKTAVIGFNFSKMKKEKLSLKEGT
jgi:hypothetical protein